MVTMRDRYRTLALLAFVFALAAADPAACAKDIDTRLKESEARLAAKPNDAGALLQRANILRVTRRYNESISLYQKYMRLFPNGQDVPFAKAAIGRMQDELRVVPTEAYAKLSPRDQFLVNTVHYEVWHWPLSAMPLQVFIPQQNAGLAKVARDACERWQTASNGFVSFAFTSNPADANIEFEFTTAKTGGLADAQAVTSRPARGKPQKSVIRALTINRNRNTRVPDEDMSIILQHEIGHALGLGHSGAYVDTMFSGGDPRPVSAGDIEMLRRLYTTPETVLLSEAIEALDKTGVHDLAYGRLLRLRAEAFLRAKDSASAMKDLESAYDSLVSQHEPAPPPKSWTECERVARKAFRVSYEQKDWPTSSKWCRRSIELFSKRNDQDNEAMLQASYAWICFRLHQEKEMLEAIERAQQLLAQGKVSDANKGFVRSHLAYVQSCNRSQKP
jgi:tetratricopeptide (TPR) repeat protein